MDLNCLSESPNVCVIVLASQLQDSRKIVSAGASFEQLTRQEKDDDVLSDFLLRSLGDECAIAITKCAYSGDIELIRR